MRVTKIMKAQAAADALGELEIQGREGLRFPNLAICGAEHEIVVLVQRAKPSSLNSLARMVPAQFLKSERWNGNQPTPLGCLRLFEPYSLSGLFHRPDDRQRSSH
jgi:hypothetical protein